MYRDLYGIKTNKLSGFILIELIIIIIIVIIVIIVIVILSVLEITALPKFLDLNSNAATSVGCDIFSDVTYKWNASRGSSNRTSVTSSYFQSSQEAGYKVFIHQARTFHSYCHFYYLDGVDLTKTPYLLYDADNGVKASGVMDISNGITWSDSLTLYN